VEQEIHLADEHFGEGIVVVDDRIYQLTWKSNVGFIYDRASFEQVGEFAYPMEGWGLTYDGTHLIMSDGTPTITFRDPTTFAEVRRIDVVDRGTYIAQLNELEYVDGEILAHVWLTDWVVRIDPMTGKVLGWIDLSGLLAAEDRTERVDVLNGAAYDGENDRLFVTGKWWPKLFEIDLVAVE
jgi:glutamine cyclotransferase